METTATIIDEILERITRLLEVVSQYGAESNAVHTVHQIPIESKTRGDRLFLDVDKLEKGPIAELLENYPQIDSVSISGLGMLNPKTDSAINVKIAYARSHTP